MLLGTDEMEDSDQLSWQKPMAIFLAVVLLVEGLYLAITQKAPGLINNAPAADSGSPQLIGEMLFNKYLLPFEVTSILLLVAMVGAIVLTLRTKKGGQS